MKTATTPAWWTAADRAEAECLALALVDAIDEHRRAGRCAACAAGDTFACRSTRAAVAAVVDWQHGRALRSRAECLRAEQDALEAARRLASAA